MTETLQRGTPGMRSVYDMKVVQDGPPPGTQLPCALCPPSATRAMDLLTTPTLALRFQAASRLFASAVASPIPGPQGQPFSASARSSSPTVSTRCATAQAVGLPMRPLAL